MPHTSVHPSTAPVGARRLTGPLAVTTGAAGLVWFASWGEGTGGLDGTLAVLGALASSLPALAYLLAAVGLGRAARPLMRGCGDALALQAAVGLSLMLTISHLLGWAGAFGTGASGVLALVPIALGLGLLAHQIVRAARERAGGRAEGGVGAWRAPDALMVVIAPGVALLLVASCNPPGWLWSSEFNGYDALSYHLQLPQEWLAAGRLRPLDHNVYSYLPGYVEGAFLHLAAALNLPREAGADSIGYGLTAHESAGAIACQVLHALMAVMAAVMTGRVTAWLAARGSGSGSGSLAGTVAGGLVLLTPWTIVVGSLAYNEMAMLALFAGALLAAFDDGVTPARRGVLCGWLVGVACGVKPTALLFVGAPVGIALACAIGPRAWVRVGLAGAAAGLAALAPWMVRNAMACGNPVFPFAAGLLGNGHWTADQVARYRAAHAFEGGVLERLRLLVVPGPVDPRNPEILGHRGMMHAQWFAFFPVVGAACVGMAAWVVRAGAGVRGAAARPGVVLVIGLLAQVAAWLFATHLQSRFLLPLLVPGAMLVGLCVGWVGTGAAAWRKMLARVIGGGVLAAQLVSAAIIFGFEHGQSPNRLLVAGAGVLTGELFAPHPLALTEEEIGEVLDGAPVESFINITLVREGEREGAGAAGAVYLLGDATPFYYSRPVLYHTTFDPSPLGAAMRRAPGDERAWSAELRGRGVRYVLYSPGEVRRLGLSGWYDPLVTDRVITSWLGKCAVLVREWPAAGKALFELRDPAAVESAR